MPIKIKIDSGSPTAPVEKKEPQGSVSLQAHKTLDGNILINDHEKMDIIIVPSQKKVVTLPKPYVGENVYDYQRGLLDDLFREGTIVYDSIQGGSMFGTLEGVYPENDKIDPVQAILLGIEKYITRSAQSQMKAEEYDKDIEDRFTDPTDEDSTKWGSIKPQQDEPYQYDIDVPGYVYAGYGYMY